MKLYDGILFCYKKNEHAFLTDYCENYCAIFKFIKIMKFKIIKVTNRYYNITQFYYTSTR